MYILKNFLGFAFFLLSFFPVVEASTIITGAERTKTYFPLLEGKRVGIVANHTSLVGGTHLADTLLSANIPGMRLVKIFSPEHGLRGNADAGAPVKSSMDAKTGLQVISLYGKNFKPDPTDLEDLDIMIFDLQDAGVRFYTYLSTLHYVMESCAESRIPLLLLDRPNPNGNYIDGPLLEPGFRSFVGMHPVPVVYGMTIGEYARMINGEGWLDGGVKCCLTVVKCLNYNHGDLYKPPVPPSPNLPDYRSIRLYPSLCFFEGTVISEGRGTDFPFQVFGHPELQAGDFYFTPVSKPGASLNPKLKGQKCRGFDLRKEPVETIHSLNLDWIISAYKNFPHPESFFNTYFTRLSGSQELQRQIEMGWDTAQIRKSWWPGLENFKKIREKYLIYKEI